MERRRNATLERLAERANMEIWEDTVVLIACVRHGVFSVHGGYADATGANGGVPCPECGAVCEDTEIKPRNAWFYWCCSPGCLPDSEASGPYKTYREALIEATEGLDDDDDDDDVGAAL
jgi:Formamidopyrimidine-DNA glycosylase